MCREFANWTVRADEAWNRTDLELYRVEKMIVMDVDPAAT